MAKKTIQYSRIIFYGCSFTAGNELSDHIDLGISVKECDTIKRKSSVPVFYSKTLITDPKIRHINDSNLSYAKTIAQHLNLEYINRAESGSSMQYILYHIERDFLQGLILDTDIVFVGITCQNRWFYIDEKNKPRRPMPLYAPHWPNEEVRYNHLKFFTGDGNLAYHWYQCLHLLNLMGNTKIKLFMQFVHSTADDRIEWANKPLSADVKSMLTSIKSFNTILDHNYSFTNIIDWNDYSQIHGFMHPQQHKHQEFADHIKYILEERINE